MYTTYYNFGFNHIEGLEENGVKENLLFFYEMITPINVIR